MKTGILTTVIFTLTLGTGIFAQFHDNGSGFSTVEYNYPTCNNASNGWISVTVDPDWSMFDIVWNTGAIGGAQYDLTAGTYVYSITNSYGDVVSDTIVLDNPAPFELQAEVIQPTSNTAQNGEIILSTTMGTGYDFNWTMINGSGLDVNSFDQTSLGAGIYKLFVENGNGCSAAQVFTLVGTTPTWNEPATGIATSTLGISQQHRNILVGSSPMKGRTHIITGSTTKTIDIYTNSGVKVSMNSPLAMTDTVQTLDINPGFYVAVFQFEDGTYESRSFNVE